MPALDRLNASILVVSSRWTQRQVLAFVRGRSPVDFAVIRRVVDAAATYLYAVPWEDFSDILQLEDERPDDQRPDDRPGSAGTIEQIFNLHESTSSPQIGPGDDAPRWQMAVVVQGDRVLGVVTPDLADLDLDSASIFDPDASGHSGRESHPGGARPSQTRPPPPPPFSAQPRLDAPASASTGAVFAVTVGFRPETERDEMLQDVAPIHISDPQPGVKMLVVLTAEGATVDGKGSAQLELDLAATVTFTCKVRGDAREVRLKVQYFYQNELLGGALRQMAVASPLVADLGPGLGAAPLAAGSSAADAPAAGPSASGHSAAGNPCRLGQPGSEDAVDFLVSVLKVSETELEWTLMARRPAIQDLGLRTTIADARQFARDVEQKLNKSGVFAFNSLGAIGQRISRCMPDLFWQRLREVQAAVGAIPTVLLVTDEPYIPWELARMGGALFDDGAPATLGAQTSIGRWWFADHVAYPPAAYRFVRQLTAVAGRYTLESGVPALPQAEDEVDVLHRDYGAALLTATSDDLGALCAGPAAGSQLLHLALHGLSKPLENDQAIVLQDGTTVDAESLVGSHDCGQDPLFDFVFFNACQLGTPGASLGMPAGFPGAFVGGGAQGFIAPLWEVVDVQAHDLALAFYAAVFKDGRRVGEVLRELRRGYDRSKHTTPLAYIYYGHPKLRMTL